ncbi:hypothetical protein HYR99_16550 [Candidatus Poribacteria bacterium]|nr:hypothetical protein [Candidatus Poribacteria bacterium]
MSAPSLKTQAMCRVSQIADKVFEEKEVYRRRVDRADFLGIYATLMDEKKLSPEEVLSIAEAELTRRIRQTMAARGLAGLLSDLTPEQMAIFDAAVEGR